MVAAWCAVMAMIGTREPVARSRRRICAAALNPSMPGISMSISTASNRWRPLISTASRPLLTTVTVYPRRRSSADATR